MPENISQRIIDFLTPVTAGLTAADVRIGLGYTSVRLSNGNAGLGWTAERSAESCTHELRAGTLAGSAARELLDMLGSGKPLARSVGLATANALVAGLPHPESSKEDVLDIVKVQAEDSVVMVGYFGPVIPVLKKTGCRLDVLELKIDKPGTLSLEEGREALAKCSVAIITGTAIVTGTMDELWRASVSRGRSSSWGLRPSCARRSSRGRR
jgi:uncharacterized protein (DUF4213/DUF364 family)